MLDLLAAGGQNAAVLEYVLDLLGQLAELAKDAQDESLSAGIVALISAHPLHRNPGEQIPPSADADT